MVNLTYLFLLSLSHSFTTFLLLNRFAKFINGMEKRLPIFIAANKIDRKYEAVTWQEDLEPLASTMDASIYMISSRVSDTVSSMMKDIAIKLMEKKNEKRN